jgi:hypothetical protein
MKHSNIFRTVAVTIAILALSSVETSAHCDTMNGPVVKAARQALDSRDVRYALIWVQPANEPEIRSAFERALSVRALGVEAKALADRYFFETLVRVHRAGEGAPYTGLKDSDVVVEPGIAAAELALDKGSAEGLSKEMSVALQHQLEESFRRIQNSKAYQPENVEAGRRYVASYVSYIHYVERLHKAIESANDGYGTPAEDHIHQPTEGEER